MEIKTDEVLSPKTVETKVSSCEAEKLNDDWLVGSCKWFNVTKGWGFITPAGSEISPEIHQTPKSQETHQPPEIQPTPQSPEVQKISQTLEPPQISESCELLGDVFVHQSSLQMTGFRCLAQGEQIEFKVKYQEGRWEAVAVRGPNGVDCVGTKRKYKQKHKKKIRCFNCGDVGNHLAAACSHPALPKRCHHCKSESHLIAECQLLKKSEESHLIPECQNLKQTECNKEVLP